MTHPWHDIDPGPYPPANWTAVIEIPRGSNVKYELDEGSGLLRMNRVLHSAVFFPANYGFIPQTLAEDDDPLDMLVLCQEPVAPLTLIEARPIGVLAMRDDNRPDHKILGVATGDPEYHLLQAARQLPEHRLAALRRFFLDYQALEGKSVEVEDFEAAERAQEVIAAARQRYLDRYRRPDR
jgi:inorganic pyrophosphatase